MIMRWHIIGGTNFKGKLTGKEYIYEFWFELGKKKTSARNEITFLEFKEYKGFAICFN